MVRDIEVVTPVENSSHNAKARTFLKMREIVKWKLKGNHRTVKSLEGA